MGVGRDKLGLLFGRVTRLLVLKAIARERVPERDLVLIVLLSNGISPQPRVVFLELCPETLLAVLPDRVLDDLPHRPILGRGEFAQQRMEPIIDSNRVGHYSPVFWQQRHDMRWNVYPRSVYPNVDMTAFRGGTS